MDNLTLKVIARIYTVWREVWCAETERPGAGTDREDCI